MGGIIEYVDNYRFSDYKEHVIDFGDCGKIASEKGLYMNTKLIQSHPSVMMGKPVVSGTRISVELILEKLSAGETIEQLLESHPRLTREAIFAALDFAAKALRADVVYPVMENAA